MSHPQQLFFVGAVKQFLGGYFQGTKVLEIGSLNINGSVRQFFEGGEYLGLDIGEGKDVDLVCHGEDYGGKCNDFDVVISCEAMEHNPAWRKTWLNMLRLVKESGLVVMTCATTGRRQHGTVEYAPNDSPLTIQNHQNYYKNLTEEDFKALIPCDSWFSVWTFAYDHTSHDLYFFGVGLDAPEETKQKAIELRAAVADHYYRNNILGIQ